MTKLNWGLIGGGEGSQIGPAHRLAAAVDGEFAFVAGALDHRPEAGRTFGQELGLVADRAYGNWREMLEGERHRPDRIDLVTIATPNATHFEIAKAYLEAGFSVLCEKPMTMTVEEGEEIVRLAESSSSIFAVNYGYTGYPLVRHMRAMVKRGDLGRVRLVFVEFAHGLAIQVFGEKGGLRWAQEQPNQLFWTPLHGRLQVIERGESGLSPEADRASRVTIGHAEGMPLAFANIYKDLAEAIRARKEARRVDPALDLCPRAVDGLRSMAKISLSPRPHRFITITWSAPI